MGKVYDRLISIQKINETTEQWEGLFWVHANVNKAKSDNEYLNGGAIQGKRSLVFEIRYFREIEDISLNIQSYRVVYQGVPYDITDYDDFMMKHKTVKIMGVSY